MSYVFFNDNIKPLCVIYQDELLDMSLLNLRELFGDSIS